MISLQGIEIPNRVDELTVEQFDYLSAIDANESLDVIEKWIAKFKYLGVDEDVFDEMPLPEFYNAIKSFNEVGEMPTERVYSIELDGYTYSTKEAISTKDLSILEKRWKKDRSTFGADCLSTLFKRDDLTKTEHYADAHLKHKKNLFKGVKCEFAIPHLIEVIKAFTATVEDLNGTAK